MRAHTSHRQVNEETQNTESKCLPLYSALTCLPSFFVHYSSQRLPSTSSLPFVQVSDYFPSILTHPELMRTVISLNLVQFLTSSPNLPFSFGPYLLLSHPLLPLSASAPAVRVLHHSSSPSSSSLISFVPPQASVSPFISIPLFTLIVLPLQHSLSSFMVLLPRKIYFSSLVFAFLASRPRTNWTFLREHRSCSLYSVFLVTDTVLSDKPNDRSEKERKKEKKAAITFLQINRSRAILFTCFLLRETAASGELLLRRSSSGCRV